MTTENTDTETEGTEPETEVDETANTDDGDQPEKVEVDKAQLDALRAELAKSRRTAKKAEADAKKTADQKAADEGKWKELAEQREKELAEAKSRLENIESSRVIEGVAKSLGFAYPDIAGSLLPADVDRTDESAVKSALQGIAKDRPRLLADTDGDDDESNQPQRNGAPVRTRRNNRKTTDMNDLIRQRAGRS